MKVLFVDAVYWIALLSPRDSLHEQAVSLSRSLDQTLLVTTEMVLTEILNAFAKQGAAFRRAAAALILRLQQDTNARIIPQNSAQFDESFQLFRSRPDKQWCHTDCASFLFMEKEGITGALTYDRHFERVGFQALMRS